MEKIELDRVTDRQVPVNVVMGTLGSGKTTVIINLVKQVAGDDYKVIWLKNEYGDVNVDGLLARERGIKTQEIMNGCLCCTAIGNIEDAVRQVLALGPDRIVIETAGTAHPAPIAMELKRFPDILIDSFIEVVDAVNFQGYRDRTVVGQSHAKYVDFVVINKVGLVDDRRLDEVIDRINDNYTFTPKIKTVDGTVPADLVFGIDGKSAVRQLSERQMRADAHSPEAHLRMESFSCRAELTLSPAALEAAIRALPPDDVYRVKGAVLTPDGWQVINSVANRITWQPLAVTPESGWTEILFIGPSAKEHEKPVKDKLGFCR